MARAAETRFTRSGDVDIAYQVFGDGERDIVMTMGWVTHLEVMWELPELAYFLERLAGIGRVIIFDKRGTGLFCSCLRAACMREAIETIIERCGNPAVTRVV